VVDRETHLKEGRRRRMRGDQISVFKQDSTVRCIAVQCSAVQYSAVQFGAVSYSVAQYSTLQRSKVHLIAKSTDRV
jgi:hypothetical protein